MDPNLRRLLDEAANNVEQRSVAEVARLIEDGEIDLVLDVREPFEWENGRIEGAVHIPLGDLQIRADPNSAHCHEEVRKHTGGKVLVYCSHGVRSLLGANALKKLGYSDVSSMEGGLTGWHAEGHPIDT